MPAISRIDPDCGAVVTTMSGHVTDDDLLAQQQRLPGEAGFQPGMHHLVDARGVEAVSVTPAGVRALANGNVFSAASRRAIVAPRDAAFGFGRMFELLRGDGVEETRVFRDMDEARRWLELDG
ncbi:MAG TPA: hypothetical protein VFE05_01975 [Longimicrobiaceae bacterium]|jgi:hypothetical protein|nr:hypothetical protein [Longimicrobiaceae bacterium]